MASPSLLLYRFIFLRFRESEVENLDTVNQLLGRTVNQVNAAGRPTETRDRSQSAWWCVEWRVRMNHTSQKWPEFGGFSQLRSPLTSFLIGAAASPGASFELLVIGG
jgi:hypothetical protein